MQANVPPIVMAVEEEEEEEDLDDTQTVIDVQEREREEAEAVAEGGGERRVEEQEEEEVDEFELAWQDPVGQWIGGGGGGVRRSPPPRRPPAAPAQPAAAPAAGRPPVLTEIENPAPVIDREYICAVDDNYMGHGDYLPGLEDPVLPKDYFVIFEEGIKSDYVEGIGNCCVLACVQDGAVLESKSSCEYPNNWDGFMTLTFYTDHQAVIYPRADDSLAIINLLVNHYA